MQQEPDSHPPRSQKSHHPSTGKPKRTPHKRRRPRWYRITKRAGIALIVLLVLSGVGLTGADYYTTRPNFCGTCHVMDPYYKSWSHDLHGAKLGVLCVQCHYAPGERFTLHAKFKGLSQVASYFSGRYGAARPRAHVADESCLVSNCHGNRDFMPKLLVIGKPRMETRMVDGQPTEVMRSPTVHFFHDKHLDVKDRQEETEAAIAAIQSGFRAKLAVGAFERLQSAARSVEPAEQRTADLDHLVGELALSKEDRDKALEWSDLEHRELRIKQLEGLHCASCHNYDGTGGGHLAVNQAVCFNCHFANQEFNHATGECLTCHEPPTRSILVHAPTTSQSSEAVMMDHQDVMQRGIDCASCHYDVIRGAATVSRRECTHCHDQDKFTVGFDQRDTVKVAEYHAIHVAQQRARCEDCHLTIAHGLLKPNDVASAGFLDLVRDDCQHCHPAHHAEQMHMLTGTGGAGLPRAVPNAMLGSRLNCRACHTQPSQDAKGDALVRANAQSCVQCHGPDYADLFDQWRNEIMQYAETADARLKELEQAMRERDIPSPELTKLLDEARQNIRLVRIGGGLHNRPFALQLLDIARTNLDKVDQQVHGIQ